MNRYVSNTQRMQSIGWSIYISLKRFIQARLKVGGNTLHMLQNLMHDNVRLKCICNGDFHSCFFFQSKSFISIFHMEALHISAMLSLQLFKRLNKMWKQRTAVKTRTIIFKSSSVNNKFRFLKMFKEYLSGTYFLWHKMFK